MEKESLIQNKLSGPRVHPTAIVSQDTELADDVEIGPFALIEGKVKIGRGCRIGGRAMIGSEHGEVIIGENNRFAPMSFVGGPPQDISYKNERTTLVIGNNNTFREFCTISIGTAKGKGTSVQDNNYFMAYTHLGHDVRCGSNVVVANDSHIAGHTIIEDHVKIMGVCAFQQNVTVGKYVFLAGASVVTKDLLPFTQAQGNYAVSRATNKVGLQRSGVSADRVANIHKAVRSVLMGGRTIEESIAMIESECEMNEDIRYMIEFIRSSRRGIAR